MTHEVIDHSEAIDLWMEQIHMEYRSIDKLDRRL